jgi:hypothetical protein
VCIYEKGSEHLAKYTFIPERDGAENKYIFFPIELFFHNFLKIYILFLIKDELFYIDEISTLEKLYIARYISETSFFFTKNLFFPHACTTHLDSHLKFITQNFV